VVDLERRTVLATRAFRRDVGGSLLRGGSGTVSEIDREFGRRLCRWMSADE
jgi:hypothetical protein